MTYDNNKWTNDNIVVGCKMVVRYHRSLLIIPSYSMVLRELVNL
jgi:hypothetical protein